MPLKSPVKGDWKQRARENAVDVRKRYYYAIYNLNASYEVGIICHAMLPCHAANRHHPSERLNPVNIPKSKSVIS